MYTTAGSMNSESENFGWDEYFLKKNEKADLALCKIESVINETRRHLTENESVFGFVFHRVMKSLLQSLTITSTPSILELGAASGFLTRWLVQKYGGTGTLVDKSLEAYKMFLNTNKPSAHMLSYLREDIFTLSLPLHDFDIVCSFGLVEHFVGKGPVLECHKKNLKNDGLIIIMIPLDSPLTRAFYEVNFELNQGYRELLTEKELSHVLNLNGLEIVSSAKSNGYVYDFLGVACTLS